jgi:hypothetical protein
MEKVVNFMYLNDKKQQLKDFASALSIPVGLTDSAKWPVRSGSVIFPVRNILVKEFIKQIEESDIIGNPANWCSAFESPTQLWRMSHHLINGLIDDNIPEKIIAEKILLLIEGISEMSNGHYFYQLGNHKILTDTEVKQLEKIKTITDDNVKLKKLLQLSGLLWAYSETNYFVAHELSCEYHGMYQINSDCFAVVRDFRNLKPSDLWSNRDYKDLPNHIRIVTFHNNDLKIKFDVYNNLYDEYGTLIKSLIGGYVTVDNKEINLSETTDYISLIANKISIFTDSVNALQHSEIAHKYMEIFWYRKKSLANYIGVNWSPNTELYDVLDQGLQKGQVKKPHQQKTTTARTAVEQLAIDFDFSNYVE